GGNGAGSILNGFGGAIHSQATLSLTQCTFTNNSSTEGGALLQAGGTGTLSRCTLAGNRVRGFGSGGAIAMGSATMNLFECTLANNTAPNYGGAIESDSGSVNLQDCTLSGNSAVGAGGGGINLNGGSAFLANCIIASNTSSYNAGADLFSAG